ncbi:MAG: CPBP family intramembrane metalloprotease [Spirochaetales bacterium]|nr:CPBP family intramembrane metalloprotease [Spirochaetales bacterium]
MKSVTKIPGTPRRSVARQAAAAACVAILAATAPRATAQAASSPESSGYVYGDAASDVLMADLVGFGLTFSTVGLNFLGSLALGADGDYGVGDQILSSSITELSSVNLFVAGSPDALALSLAGAALLGGEWIAAETAGLYSREQQWFYWAKNNLAMYKSYDAYAAIRERSSAWGDDGFGRLGALELLAQPFNPDRYAEPLLWGAVGVTLATVVGQWALSPEPGATSPFTTGEWYLGDEPSTPAGYWLSHSLYFLSGNALGALGEEGVYRGVLHEELSLALGSATATVLDSGLFAGMHLATDLARGLDWKQILVHVAGVTVNNVIFDLAYERGGLPAAVAAHAAANFAGNILASFLYGGVPSTRLGN